MVPSAQGLCESYRTICSKYVVQVYFKGGNTLKNLLMFPKNREAITKQSDIIYCIKCGRTECDDEYIGESARTFKREVQRTFKSTITNFEHQNITGHRTTVENFKIISREGHNMAGAIKEAIYFRVNNPTPQ